MFVHVAYRLYYDISSDCKFPRVYNAKNQQKLVGSIDKIIATITRLTFLSHPVYNLYVKTTQSTQNTLNNFVDKVNNKCLLPCGVDRPIKIMLYNSYTICHQTIRTIRSLSSLYEYNNNQIKCALLRQNKQDMNNNVTARQTML